MGSVEVAPLKVMAVPATPEYGPPAFAIGDWPGGGMVAVVPAEAVRSSVLVTVSLSHCLAHLLSILDEGSSDYEIVLVNSGSTWEEKHTRARFWFRLIFWVDDEIDIVLNM